MAYLQNITEEELLLNESFHNWVKGLNQADIHFWEEWIAKHPEHGKIVHNARNIILSLAPEQPDIPQHKVEEAWKQLQQTLAQRKSLGVSGNRPSGRSSRKLFNWWYLAAAMFAGFCIMGWQYSTTSRRVESYTGFGETKALVLPDGSQVTLNGNTRLSYKKEWDKQEDREVWLEGEAYFYVVKYGSKGNSKFTVHTDKLDVEVLGTQFNVSDRKCATLVVLNEGQVKINTNTESQPVPLIMNAGELLEYSGKRKAVIKKVANPQMYSSWKFKMMVFEETSIKEIANRIESTYGYQVVFADKALASRKLTGTIPSDNIDVLLLTLAKLFNLDIQKAENQIFIKSTT
jgi:ferric-dicitrate binding protein FerR (iron transport regulator)